MVLALDRIGDRSFEELEDWEQEALWAPKHWDLRSTIHVATRMLQKCRSCRIEIERDDDYYSRATVTDRQFDWWYEHWRCH